MTGVMSRCTAGASDGEAGSARKVNVDEMTPASTVSTASEVDDFASVDTESGDDAEEEDTESGGATTDEEPATERQLGPGLFPPTGVDDDEAEVDDVEETTALSPLAGIDQARRAAEEQDSAEVAPGEGLEGCFTPQETLFVVDWDDTILPSSWIRRQGLRLDSGSVLTPRQREVLAPIAAAAAAMLSAAKLRGTVVLLTNAERGWIELSCQKFLPMLLPVLDHVKIVSARTSYEGPSCVSPLDWKVRAFEVEIARACGAENLVDPTRRKNIHSLGDSIWEREALMRATADLPSCLAKSVKFVDKPDICQLLKQLDLVTESIDRIVQHDDHLDMCIKC